MAGLHGPTAAWLPAHGDARSDCCAARRADGSGGAAPHPLPSPRERPYYWKRSGGSSSVVERLLAKEEVAGSTPVFRSTPPTLRAPLWRLLEGRAASRDAGSRAEVAELVDATVSNTVGVHAPCGFESHLRHQCFQRFSGIGPRRYVLSRVISCGHRVAIFGPYSVRGPAN